MTLRVRLTLWVIESLEPMLNWLWITLGEQSPDTFMREYNARALKVATKLRAAQRQEPVQNVGFSVDDWRN